MKPTKRIFGAAALAAFLGLPLFTLACSSAAEQAEAPLAGATLWQQQCIRCHEYRTPAAYSDPEWETVLLHMRTRANLPAEDVRDILEFMKSAN